MYMNLKLEMRKRNIKQQDIASCLNINQRAVSLKVTGKTRFTPDEQQQVQSAFFPDCDTDYLFQIWNPDLSGLYQIKTPYTRDFR